MKIVGRAVKDEMEKKEIESKKNSNVIVVEVPIRNMNNGQIDEASTKKRNHSEIDSQFIDNMLDSQDIWAETQDLFTEFPMSQKHLYRYVDENEALKKKKKKSNEIETQCADSQSVGDYDILYKDILAENRPLATSTPRKRSKN